MIIGISGKKNSGKSTVSKILNNKGFYLDSFASTVKDIAALLFSYCREKLEGNTIEDRLWRETEDENLSKFLGKSFSPRNALTLIGTEFGRNMLHENIWIKTVFDRYEQSPNQNLVITDVRFSNEFDSIKSYKNISTYNIRINRPENTISEHISETALDEKDRNGEFDYYIINDGTINDLESKINLILDDIKKKIS
jgi:hypothetical protein